MQRTYQPSFFDESDRYHKLDKLNDPLVEPKQYIDFEMFRPKLEEICRRPKQTNVGRKPLDVVMMFKLLILQRLYNLSDQQVEFQVNDRLSFSRFVGLPLGEGSPDFTTVWRFREAIAEAGAARELFDLFTALLEERGLVTREGTIVDASFVEVPRQRNYKEENDLVKIGQIPEYWKKNPKKLSQKDVDARWTKKGNVSYYGYKDHVKVDAESKLITDYEVTDASVHDSMVLFDLVDETCCGERLFADSAYSSEEIGEALERLGIDSFISEKGRRNNPLTKLQKGLNSLKAKVRCLVEHIFGYIENSMGGPEQRYIGMKRNVTSIGLCNLAYNMMRYIQLVRGVQAPVA